MKRTTAVTGAAALLLLLGSAGAPGQAPEACRPLLPSEGAEGTGLPADWTVRPVGGADAPQLRTARTEDGAAVLRARSQGAAAFAWVVLEPPVRGEGELRWRWRTATPIPEARLRDPQRDDSPLRLFVVFGAASVAAMGDRGRAIFYSWGNHEEPGTRFLSHVSDRIAVWVLREATDADGSWRREVRDPFDDYRAVFDGEPPPIRAVGILPDTDQTGAAAVAEVRQIRWCPSAGSPPEGTPPGSARAVRDTVHGSSHGQAR